MLKIVGCITQQHDVRLVLLAAAVCFISCFTALGLLARARLHQTIHWSWLSAASVVAGAGVWSTHFIAMLAYKTAFIVGYDVTLTALSVALAVVASFAAFYVAI